ncbi:putative protein FAR1-RELATED SEQUENCE 10 [Bidens hawaiensis]|uniref:putative protein FAR1-RELATED SEQUENCE 10 n=1 Tax=Bidens hawaiensis TaxID=980011 RepID=UPI0040498417
MDLYDILFGDGNDEQSGYAYNDQPEQSGLPDLNELRDLNHEPGYGNIEQGISYTAVVTLRGRRIIGHRLIHMRPESRSLIVTLRSKGHREGGDDDVDDDDDDGGSGDRFIRETSFSYYFDSVAELVDWVKKTGREHGCVISVQRSRERSVKLVCNRGGEPKLKGTVRHTGSIKRGCPFKLVGRYNAPGDCWKVEVVNETHNHDPVLFEEGRPTLRKLTDEEIDMVATLHRQGLRPAKIKSALKKSFPGNKCITRDINNVVKVLRDQDKIGDTPMQVLENFLQTHGFTFYTWENPSTNRTENVFFSHEKSHTMWRVFPDLLLIDTTYNTNMYKWSFVQFVGVTSTSKSFCIAHAVIFREQECNFTWALERLKDMLVDCREPRVILTDRDQALMNACETVFPNATKNLCRWHIMQNI